MLTAAAIGASRAATPRDRRVDAVAGRHERRVGHDVRRRVAELAAALVAVRDLAGERERLAEQVPGVLDRAAQHEPADVARRDDLAVDLEQLDDPRLEAPVGAQQLGVALRLVAEAEVLADRDVRRAERADEHVVDELLRAARGELAVERDDDELLDAERRDELRLALQVGEQARRGARLHDGGRMRLERQDGVGARDDLAVAEVHAVERPDRDAPRARLDVGQARDLHARKPTTGFSAPSRGSATAIGPSASTSSTAAAPSPSRRRRRRRARRAARRRRPAHATA